MKRIILFIMSVFSIFGCSAIAQDEDEQKFKSVLVDEFEKVIANDSVVIVDVRTPREYAEGHIAKAIIIDVLNDSFEQKATSTLPKDKTIAIYCRSGKRSKKAGNILAAHGYKVVELDNGYLGWIAEGKKVEK